MALFGKGFGIFSRFLKGIPRAQPKAPAPSAVPRPTKLKIRPQFTVKDILWDMKHIKQPDPIRLILDFKDPDMVNYFKIFTDASMGGSSEALLKSENGVAVFEGILNTELTEDMQKKGFVNMGYAAIQTVEIEPPLDVELYDALQIRIKSDDRLYVAQLKTDSPYEDDMYQFVIPAPKEAEVNQWREVLLPFDGFILTSRGQIEDPQIPYDGRNTLNLGFLSAQRRQGPFRLEIEWIRAVRSEFIRNKKRYTIV